MELLGKNMKTRTNTITGSTPARLFFFLMARQKIRPILIPLSGKNLIIFNDFTPKNVTKYYFFVLYSSYSSNNGATGKEQEDKIKYQQFHNPQLALFFPNGTPKDSSNVNTPFT